MRVDFYHLTIRPAERVLPRIAERVLADGGRLLVVSAAEGQRAALDRFLWSYEAESFLPHGCAGAGDEAAQPVLIAPTPEPANGARVIAVTDGRWRDEAFGFDDVRFFFDEEAIEGARAAWRGVKARGGAEARYWRQKEEGGWERVA